MKKSLYRRTRAAVRSVIIPPAYDADGMQITDKTVPFMGNQRFQAAYQSAVKSNDHYKAIHLEWRIHVACWAAQNALNVRGDFVECGVCDGFTSVAICNYVDFNSTGRYFWLFNTFH